MPSWIGLNEQVINTAKSKFRVFIMSLLRSMATVSGFTALSRILGFVRDIFMGYFLGTGHAADAFFAAFKFPNIFRRIFGEGAFNSAFVPLFSKELTSK